MPKAIRVLSRVSVFAAALVLPALMTLLARPLFSAEQAHQTPAPISDEAAGVATSETAVLAGGCFWGVQGVYQHVDGVKSAVSGYAGGEKETAQYYSVGKGTTGHAESVRITFDPRRISYGRSGIDCGPSLYLKASANLLMQRCMRSRRRHFARTEVLPLGRRTVEVV
jgi:peptide-methionine (S)-S-oxide reductase